MGYYEERQRKQHELSKRLIKVEAYIDHVIVCGQTIKRPSGVTPSQWFDIWESFAA